MEFTPQNKTANKVLLEDATWQFVIKEINGDALVPWINLDVAGRKKEIRLYTALDSPKDCGILPIQPGTTSFSYGY